MENTAELTAEANPMEEPSVTMVDVLADEIQRENESAAVLGGSDEKICTFSQGPVKRQALYSCLTCCPEARSDLEKSAGICLACSYRCHENHELVELYTKRNFRCDCPTERMSGPDGRNKCVLNASLEKAAAANQQNTYNQNFVGLYCTCRRPYPDPERTTEEVMLQCAICEDWYHTQHLDVPSADEKLAETAPEVICGACMGRHTFLQDYTGLALKALEEADESQANITVTGDVSVCEESDNKLHSELDKSITDIMNLEGGQQKQDADDEKTDEPKSKKPKVEEVENPEKPKEPIVEGDSKCKRPKNKTDYVKGATFWGNDWRSALCRCDECLQLYKEQQVEYLLDPEDPWKLYEARGIKSTESSYERGIKALASIGHVQQIDAIIEYNRMTERFKTYLQKFAATKKVVTEEDINRFFADMRNEKLNTATQQQHFCR